jgi:hypothetical protein
MAVTSSCHLFSPPISSSSLSFILAGRGKITYGSESSGFQFSLEKMIYGTSRQKKKGKHALVSRPARRYENPGPSAHVAPSNDANCTCVSVVFLLYNFLAEERASIFFFHQCFFTTCSGLFSLL